MLEALRLLNGGTIGLQGRAMAVIGLPSGSNCLKRMCEMVCLGAIIFRFFAGH
jgi:hypothetical protein